MPERRRPGECMTEAERLRMVAAIERIGAEYQAGRLTLAQAQHEAAQVIAPLKRRVRSLARRPE